MGTQNLNQFKQTAVVGDVDLATNPNPNVFTCRFVDASETAATVLIPGESVKLIDLSTSDYASPPIVDEMADDNDGGAFGVVVRDTKSAEKVTGDIVQIAAEGTVAWMEASAAIARGADVAAVHASPGEVVTQTTEDKLGIALDHAAADGDLLRVLIKPVAVAP